MGHDAAGNRYYENRVDYPFGQHRWVSIVKRCFFTYKVFIEWIDIDTLLTAG